MSTSDTKRDQLITKLKEMFQMDQADLDFGIYRIMNAKRDEVERFLDRDLLPTLRTTLEEFQPAGLADKHKELACLGRSGASNRHDVYISSAI